MSSPAKRMRLSASRASLAANASMNANANANVNANVGTGVNVGNRNTSAGLRSGGYDIITGEAIENQPVPTVSNPLPPPSIVRPSSRSGLSQPQPQPQPPPLKRTQLRQSMSQAQLHAAAQQQTPTQMSNGQQQYQQQQQEEMLNLRAKANALEYELKTLQSERGLVALQHEKELREAQARADADYNKCQTAEAERVKAVRLQESVQREAGEVRDRAINEKASLERRLRDVQGRLNVAVEEKEEVEGRLGELEREYERFRIDEVDGKRSSLETTLRDVREELEGYRVRYEAVSKRLDEREHEIEGLEKKNMDLGAQVGGGEELEVLKREFGDQLAYVRRLEGQTRDQNAELRKLRDERRAVNVVEEEKRALGVQLDVLRDTERKMNELEIQREILEDEKRTWTSLLDKDGNGEGEKEFESPEAVVRALVNERIEHALFIDRLGSVESELVGKDEALRALESEKNVLKEELAKLKSNSTPAVSSTETSDGKAYKRLERQRELAAKEVEYLRAQLKTYDAEETMLMENNNFDAQRLEQVKRLEGLVDEYKSEIGTLHQNLSQLESAPKPVEARGTKRPATEDLENEGEGQTGPLLRKNKNLQIALQKVTLQTQQLATELQATKTQLKALRNSSKTRILELRENPTAEAERVKMSTLRTLKEENAALMAQLRGDNVVVDDREKMMMNSNNNDGKGGLPTFVPSASLDALKLDLEDKMVVIADKEKRMRRQREIWTDKAAEFRDVISSVLGYRINFLSNGKVKVSSCFYRPTREQEDENEDDDQDDENFILFDGDKGTMKISGGNDGEFGREVRELVDFWVKEKGEIPCFLAAMTLEFYERFVGGDGDDTNNNKQ